MNVFKVCFHSLHRKTKHEQLFTVFTEIYITCYGSCWKERKLNWTVAVISIPTFYIFLKTALEVAFYGIKMLDRKI